MAEEISGRESFEILRDVIAIDSIWGKEKGLAEHIASRFAEWGLDSVELVEGPAGRPSAVGWIRGSGTGPSLMLNGHIDMYELSADWTRDPWVAEEVDGRIFGGGIADMKAGTAAIMATARHIAKNRIPLGGDLLIACVSAHFEGGVGTRSILERGHRTDAAVITEPSSMKLVTSQRAASYLEITVHGVQAHSTRPDLGVNAISKMARIVAALEELELPADSSVHPVLGTGHFINVGTIHGGTKHNQVPDRCTISVDFRVLPELTPEEVKKNVEGMIERLHAEDPDLHATVSFSPHWLSGPRYAFEGDTEWAIVRDTGRSYSSIFGRPVESMGVHGWTDMAVLGPQGIQCCNLGPGGGAINFADEYVMSEEYYGAVRLYVDLARRFCSGVSQ